MYLSITALVSGLKCKDQQGQRASMATSNHSNYQAD